MNDQSQSLLRAIRGPVIMITVGVLFAADRFTDYHFAQGPSGHRGTWPVLLIVVGLLQLFGGRQRRVDYHAPPGATNPQQSYTPPPSPPPPAPPTPRSDNEEMRS